MHAKEQLFRTLDDVNPDLRLAELESSIMGEVNKLGIGAMGFGGRVSLIGCKIGVQNRLPASFFVSVAYDCWAFRRLGVLLDAKTGAISTWLYRDPAHPVTHMADQAGFRRTGREVLLQSPLTEEQVRSLKVGDVVLVSVGPIPVGTPSMPHLMKHEPPVDLSGAVLYHCGPVVVKEGSGWKVNAAGPTTSIREEPYQADVIKRYGVRAVIGKGGMGPRTLEALKDAGAVYLNAIGGAAQFYARTITSVDGVSLTEFGTPEAMWHLTVKDFPAIVTMDAHGNSLHKEVEQESAKELAGIGLSLALNRRADAYKFVSGRFIPRGRSETMINVSTTAASKINELLAEEGKAGSGLRVFVQGGGCSGFQYGLMIEESGGAGDQVFESNGVKLFVDPVSVSYLKGAEVDFVDTVTGGGFTIKNPNATSTCGCGSSFSV